MTSKDSAEVTVKEAYLGDPGRGIARISLDVMKALSLVSGDVIEIEGRKKATAVVWPGLPGGHEEGGDPDRRDDPGERRDRDR